MNKKLQFLVFIFTFVILHSELFSQVYKKYLTTAESAANWLISLENYESSCDGLSWPESNISTVKYTGLDEGNAGIGTFFIDLYEATGTAEYLDKAKKASNYIYYQYEIGNFYGPDWIAGAASGGNYFIKLYETTGDKEYLNRAKYTANWLMETAYPEGDSYHWLHYVGITKVYTGIAHGAAGIGEFFLNLYMHTQDSIYLHYAEGAFNWITGYTVSFDDTLLGWKRLTTDTEVYNLWCGGSAGIIFFLSDLYKLTGKQIYLDYLIKTANGLVKNAVPDNDGVAWTYYTDGGSLPTVYCHGAASAVHALYLAYSIVHDQKYLDYAHLGANWLRVMRREFTSSKYYWPYFNDWEQFDTGLLTGTASVGYGFLKYYYYDSLKVHLVYATAAADYLLYIAENPTANRTRWISYTNPEDLNYGAKDYYTGWYSGAAGIGIFLVDLYQILRKDSSYIAPLVGPVDFKLSNYPNPFNSSTQIQFDLPNEGPINIEIFNILGEKVRTIMKNQYYATGSYSIEWDGRKDSGSICSSGMYLIQLKSGSRIISIKVMLLK